MASRKGIVVTVIILAAITGASFSLWFIPQNVETTFVVSDYKGYLDGVKNIHEVLRESTYIEYQEMLQGDIAPQEYIATTQITATQVTAQISEFVTSKPPEEWQESYISYMEGMRKFNEYIGETIVLANLIEGQEGQEDIDEAVKRIESLKSESEELTMRSDLMRPIDISHIDIDR